LQNRLWRVIRFTNMDGNCGSKCRGKRDGNRTERDTRNRAVALGGSCLVAIVHCVAGHGRHLVAEGNSGWLGGLGIHPGQATRPPRSNHSEKGDADDSSLGHETNHASMLSGAASLVNHRRLICVNRAWGRCGTVRPSRPPPPRPSYSVGSRRGTSGRCPSTKECHRGGLCIRGARDPDLPGMACAP
jgi:hypothetical protein